MKENPKGLMKRKNKLKLGRIFYFMEPLRGSKPSIKSLFLLLMEPLCGSIHD
jgi:hypothetical protein